MCGIAHPGGSTRALCWRPERSAHQDTKTWLAYCTGSGLVALQSFTSGDEHDTDSSVLVAEGDRVQGTHRINMVRGGDAAPAHSSYLKNVLSDFATSINWCNESTRGDELLAVGTSRGSVVLFALVHERKPHAQVSLEPVCRLVCSTLNSSIMYASFVSMLATSPADLPSGCRDMLMVATGKGVSAWDVCGSRRLVWSKEFKNNREALCGLMCSMQHMPFFVMGMDTGDVEIMSPGVANTDVSGAKASNRLPNSSSVYGIDVDARGRRLVYAKSTGDIEVVDVSDRSMKRDKSGKLLWNDDEPLVPELVARCSLSLRGADATEPDVQLSRPSSSSIEGNGTPKQSAEFHTSPDALVAMNCVKWVPAEVGDDEERVLAAGGALGLIRIIPLSPIPIPIPIPTPTTKKNKNKSKTPTTSRSTKRKRKKT